MLNAAIFLLFVQAVSSPSVTPPSKTPVAEAAEPALLDSASAKASARILRAAVFDFEAPPKQSVKGGQAKPQISRDEAGTVWAQFQ